MAGLETLDHNEPTGSRALSDGDDAIRETRQKTKESVDKEHTLEGYHTFPMGTISQIPAPDSAQKGRLYALLDEDGVNPSELWMWDGAQWLAFTRNQQTASNTTTISTHQSSNPIDHANESITRDKLLSGLLVKKHFISGSSDNGIVDELVDGSVTTLHTHPPPVIAYPPSAIQFFTTKDEVANGIGNTTTWMSCGHGISSKLKGLNAKGAILEGVIDAVLDIYVVHTGTLQPVIKIQVKDNPAEFILVRGGVVYSNLMSGVSGIGWGAQGFFPINSDGKFDYLVSGLSNESTWSIRLAGYFV